MGLTLNRVAVGLVVLVLGRVAVSGLMMGNFVAAVGAAVAAAAFASNWPIELSRPLRLLAFGVQVLTIVLMAGAIVMVLSIAEAGRTGWDDVPSWFWLIVVAVAFVVFRATAAGYVLVKEAR